MNPIRCSNCGKTFLPTGKAEEVILKLGKQGASLAMVECAKCGITTDCDPVEVITGKAASSSIICSNIQLRCPTIICTGWVCEVEDDGSSFWGCGECGNVWTDRKSLNQAITLIVKKFPYRQKVYASKGDTWNPTPEAQEPDDYEELVEQEEGGGSGSMNMDDNSGVIKILESIDADLSFDTQDNIQCVNLADADICNDDLKVCEKLTSLRELWLTCTDISNPGLRHLSHLCDLQQLYLEDTKITDAGMVHLKELTQLHVLDLRKLRINGRGFVHLSNLCEMRVLYLFDTQVDDDGLAHLTNFKKLEWLGLNHTDITDAGLRHIRFLTSLKSLDLVGTKITDEAIQHLSCLKELEILTLESTNVSKEGMKNLCTLLPNCQISI